MFRLRTETPRANSWVMVATVKAQKPKQITPAGASPSPQASATAIVAPAASSGHMNW